MICPSIAIVGLACEYPDARSPAELWEGVLAGRRAFRRMPPERLRLEDYRLDGDGTVAVEAAVIEGYAFDRVGFRVAGPSFRSADPTHWLALDVAARALADAGFDGGNGIPRETTGVFLGNTLTGEFSRAATLRLRWPYARRMIDAALRGEGWNPAHRRDFLERLERAYKEPFPPVGEETLAGSLSNTIAGRICNHFDLKGGGYTVDGACASSLLAVAHACSSLSAGDLDVAMAGGVDLSLDPFELVGFARAGALASDEMRVYDRRPTGFLPGEGCGVVVLMRLDDALAAGRRVVAVIRGWGISSDGQGGITRPEVEGQLLAIRRAYRRAGFPIGTVSYFEGHGTGTAVGDAAELSALTLALREDGDQGIPAAIGSIKANIGHTKAAAGVAGLIKAAMAVDARILPPTTGCEQPRAELTADGAALRALKKGEPWPDGRPPRAGVSAMGFGGINAHLVLESIEGPRAGPRRSPIGSSQDAELFLIGGRDADDLRRRVVGLLGIAGRLSRAELTDLAVHLSRSLDDRSARAAVVAGRPAELAARLDSLRESLDRGSVIDPAGVFLGDGERPPRIGLLFPGQGTTAGLDGGAWARRFPSVERLYGGSGLPRSADPRSTRTAQPAIIAASLAALTVLGELGIDAAIAVGHSLGELAAWHWAGAIDADALLRIAEARGRAMADLPVIDGAMAGVAADRAGTEALLNGDPVVIAGLNAPRQTVISGPAVAVDAVMDRARLRGWATTRLAVSHAFHSPMVAAAVDPLSAALQHEAIGPPRRPIASSVTGTAIPADAVVDVRGLLLRQVTDPVRFLDAMQAAAEGIDLWIEAGPGCVLAGLLAGWVGTPVIALEAGGDSLRGLLGAVGAAFALGAPVRTAPLFDDRLSRPFPEPWRPRFFANPCELAPLPDSEGPAEIGDPMPRAEPAPAPVPRTDDEPVLELLRRSVAARAELPAAAVGDESRLLGDLHLNSIAVSQIVVEVAAQIGAGPPVEPTSFATATLAQVAEALEELRRAGPTARGASTIAGVAPWTRAFVPTLVERPRPQRPAGEAAGRWRVVARPGDPLADRLATAMTGVPAGLGVIVCLPPDPDERHVGLLLEAARALLEDPAADRFVMVQHGGGASSFARTVHQELPRVSATVVDVPVDHPEAAGWIVAEAMAPGFAEVHYDEAGCRREPVLRPLPWPEPAARPVLGPDDVLLVTGGGKGIAAECALAFARETGVPLAILGRSRPDADRDLATNLARLAAAGVVFHYARADVADPDAVRAAVAGVESALGPITGIVHAAGINFPRPLGSLDEAAFGETLAAKLGGLRNLLAAVDPDRLRLLATFGSVIARTGMPGEADYGVANEWLTRAVERFGREHPGCRCLALEWSVWSGVGMGDRLGRVDALARQGIEPIPPDAGVDGFLRLASAAPPTVPVVVAGRIGVPPALPVEGAELPLLRFLERPRVDYPGIELVVDADLTTETDPYLDDHVFRGERLLPAVVGLEAMAQVAMAALRVDDPPVFEEVAFDHPVVAPPGREATVRLAALVTDPGRVEVVLRCAATGFQLDHFRAVCRFGTIPDIPAVCHARGDRPEDVPSLSPDALYGTLLFQAGRLRRLSAYRRLTSTACETEIAAAEPRAWFHRYWPGRLVLGDPAARDAVVHAIQACIPHATILPVGVDRLIPGIAYGTAPARAVARERSDLGDRLLYDVDVIDDRGDVCERWEGLRLRVVERHEPRGDWPAPLFGPYLERRIRGLLPVAMSVAVVNDPRAPRRARSDRLFRQLLGPGARIARRPDGKPEADGDRSITAAHAGDWTVAAAGAPIIACDLEPVASRADTVWRDLLGPDRGELAARIARATGERTEQSATRLWVAGECLIKAGLASKAALVLDRDDNGAVGLRCGDLAIVTLPLPDGPEPHQPPLIFGLLARCPDARV